MRVLLIHGRGQGAKKPEAILDEWLGALELGFKAADLPFPSRDVFDFPFYGDALADFVNKSKLPTTADLGAKGPGQDNDYERFTRDVLNEMQKENATLTETAIRAELPETDIGEKGPENWRWVRAIAQFIDRRWSSATDFTIERFLRDVYLYTTKDTIAAAIDKIVVDKLTDEPTVVIAHSLGTIVGYNVMKARGHELDVVKHVTVGSPLGIKAITARLGRLQNHATKGWYNAYDPNDIVALNPLDAGHFPTTPPVANYGEVVNQTSNQHGITGYLNDVAVAKTIAEAIEAAQRARD